MRYYLLGKVCNLFSRFLHLYFLGPSNMNMGIELTVLFTITRSCARI